MIIYLDDIRENPRNTILAKSVNECKKFIIRLESFNIPVELDIDHDLGDFAKDGGDGIELVKWLVETERFYPILGRIPPLLSEAKVGNEYRLFFY